MVIEALKNRIINADFRDVLKELPDKSVDLLLTDPPYAIDIVRQLVKKDPYQKHGYKSWELKEWDKERPTKKDFEEMIRVSKNQIIWGGITSRIYCPQVKGGSFGTKGKEIFRLQTANLRGRLTTKR